jgi:threonyl-tRNA synthetase
MIHRVIYGSLERFIGLLIESTAGKFPFWLSPVQVGIVPVREFHNEYAQSIADQLRDHRIRVEVDDRDAQMGGKISKFRKELLPYILIVGDKEKEANAVSVRIRDGVQLHDIPVDAFLKVVDVMNKKRELQLRDSFA